MLSGLTDVWEGSQWSCHCRCEGMCVGTGHVAVDLRSPALFRLRPEAQESQRLGWGGPGASWLGEGVVLPRCVLRARLRRGQLFFTQPTAATVRAPGPRGSRHGLQ